MIWVYLLVAVLLLPVLIQIAVRWQSLVSARQAAHRGWLAMLEWREFQALAKNGQGCLIVSTIGGGRASHLWHPKRELTENELEDAIIDEGTIKAVIPPFWCFGIRPLLQWMFPKIQVYAHDIAGFP